MGHIRVGVRRTKGAFAVDGPPQWVEIAGIRMPDEAGIFSIKHKAKCENMGIVTIKLYCGGYETVDDDAESGSFQTAESGNFQHKEA